MTTAKSENEWLYKIFDIDKRSSFDFNVLDKSLLGELYHHFVLHWHEGSASNDAKISRQRLIKWITGQITEEDTVKDPELAGLMDRHLSKEDMELLSEDHKKQPRHRLYPPK